VAKLNKHETYLAMREELGVWAYGALAVALPFIADQTSRVGIFVAIWLGGSFAAGVLVPRLAMLLAPVVALALLVVILMLGLTESEFLSDSLSIIAIWVLCLGEVALLLAGIELGKRRRGSVS